MKRLLIVEDDFFIRDMYVRVFTEEGYTVDVADDGDQALEKTKGNRFDMILLDIMIPKVNGIEVLKNCRESTHPAKDTPIFLLTNVGQDNIIKDAFKIGANGYLIKASYTPIEVVKEITSFFNKQSSGNPPSPSNAGTSTT